jgi:hypothetical protein
MKLKSDNFLPSYDPSKEVRYVFFIFPILLIFKEL